jgi:hypothetical protein
MATSDPLNELLAHFKEMEERRRGPIVPSVPAVERVVLFVDMLGFAALTEHYPIDVAMLNAHNRPFSWGLDMILSAPSNPLTEAFHGFHFALRWAIDMANMRHPVTAITFSDSAFVAFTHLIDAASLAVDLARSMLAQKIPVRMGVAFGSFAALRFRSDVTAESGDHAAEFLGTAVVRAYQTERCRIKGLRIFLHPSIHPLLKDSVHNPEKPPTSGHAIRPLECSVFERANQVGVQNELDYWDPAPTKEAAAWRGLQEMWDKAPDLALEHYQATAEAINRMRMGLGEVPLPSFRRRTLPRRKS